MKLKDSKTDEPSQSYAFSTSLDGFGAGSGQDLKNPLGMRGHELHSWMFPTETFQRMTGKNGESVGIDNDFAAQSFKDVGAWINNTSREGALHVVIRKT
jgi:hypothetical protein